MALSIRKILDQVIAGQIRVPAFQREFVWDMERVAMLMDSIHKQYPFGSLLFWRTKNQLAHERSLGPYRLPERVPDYPIDYVLDGQQRVTSIFSVFQTELPRVKSPEWLEIYFDLEAEDDAQDSQFFALPDDEVVPGRHFPLSCLFDPVTYRQATEKLADHEVRRIDQMQAVFKEAVIPVQMLDTENRAKVAIVFERVNRLGMELDTLQLLTAWTWSEDFDLQQKFTSLRERLDAYGFSEVGEDPNLILRCCAAVIQGNPSAESLIQMNGNEVRKQFERVENGIHGAVDYLRSQFHVETLRNLPFPALLVPLTVFFAEPEGKQVRHSNQTMSQLRRWFWRACFSRRYSGQTVRSSQQDISEMIKLRNGEPSRLGEFPHKVSESFFLDSQFRMAAANTKTFILLLAQQSPLTFLSGKVVDLQPKIQAYNRTEFHHMYPRAFLDSKGFSEAELSALANFCFLDRSDNNRIGGVAPSKYKSMMPSGTKLKKTLKSAVCPESLFDDDFKVFRRERAKELVLRATALMM